MNSARQADGNGINDNPHCVKQRPYVCTVCDKRFITKAHMTAHMNRHTGQKYPCTQCEKCFLSQNALSQHRNIHTGKYKCTECGRCLSTSTNLARHRQSHSGEKPFECSVCSKRFKTARNLVVHSRIHSGGKPYSCRQCSECFTTQYQLEKHMLKLHPELYNVCEYVTHVMFHLFLRKRSINLMYLSRGMLVSVLSIYLAVF